MDSVDVLVVGSGPAGSHAAQAAAEKGLSVLVLERRPQVGVPVRCGEMIPSVEEIRDMFPNYRDTDMMFSEPVCLSTKVNAIRLVDPNGKVRDFPFTGYTTDRDRFDQHFMDLAQEAGAELKVNTAFETFKGNVAQTSAGEIGFKVLIGADGPGSRVAQAAGLPANRNPYPAVSAQAKGDFEPIIQMFFGKIAPGAYGWIMPKKGGANVGVGFSPQFSQGSLRGYMEKFCEMHELELTTPMKGKYVPSEGPIAKTYTDNVMLAGDAAGVVMPVNGGGIPQAMMTGRMAGQAAYENIANGKSLALYEQDWKEILWKPLHIAANNKKLADFFAFRSDRSTAICMSILGTRRMGKLIRCKHLFP
ncbi:MAG: geranylgeranyl reductase family protein [Methanomethylophilus sp.]|jgi:digeranylgeranylglycerophospholipid reductase